MPTAHLRLLAEELGAIIERWGMAPVMAARCKPPAMATVAGLLKEQNGTLRQSALNTIEAAWVEEGEAVHKLLGR